MTQFEKLDLLLRECGGTIQTFQVLNNGISKSVFCKALPALYPFRHHSL